MARTRRANVALEGLEHRLMLAGDLRYAFGLGVTQVDMATDLQANAYIVGKFQGTVDFNPSPRRVWSATAASATGDMFVAKFNSLGALAWVKTYGSVDGAPAPAGVAVARQSTRAAIWVTGTYSGTQDFDPSASTFNMVSKGGTDIFLTGVTESGDYLSTSYVGTTADETAVDVTLDGLGRIYVGGAVTGGANAEAVAGQFNAKGRYMNTRTWASAGVDIVPTAITADGQGDFFLAGLVSGAFTFNAGPNGTVNGPSAFVLKLNPAGSFAWVNALASTNIRALSTDRTSTSGPFSVFVAGDFSGTIDADPDPTTRARLISYGGTDAFVVKYDANGVYLWRASMGSTVDDAATSVDSDVGGSVYLGGYFRQTATFQKGSTLVTRGGVDAFAVKYTRQGVQAYLDQFGGTGDDQIGRLVIGQGVDVYAIGPLKAAGNYNPVLAAPAATLAPLAGHTEDMFLLRLDS